MTRISDDTDLSSLFGIDLDAGGEPTDATDLLCSKCGGRGKFIGYTGRVIGPCFACDGTGLTRAAGVALPEGACDKCLGSGEWRPGRPCGAPLILRTRRKTAGALTGTVGVSTVSVMSGPSARR